MKKFVVLYMASGHDREKMMKNSTPEQRKKGMDAWIKWMDATKQSIVDGGAPLGKTKRVDFNGSSDTKNEIGGYSIVQAELPDAATKLFGKRSPPSANAGRLDRDHRSHAVAWDVATSHFRHVGVNVVEDRDDRAMASTGLIATSGAVALRPLRPHD